MAIKDIALACAQAVQAYAEEVGAVETYVSEAKKCVIFSVVTRLSRLEFVLTVKGSVLCPPATLFLRIYPQKNSTWSLHLCELMAAEDFRCTYFPYIESSSRLQACFAALTAVLTEYMPAIEHLVLDDAAYRQAFAHKRQTVMTWAQIAEEDIPASPQEQDAFWAEWDEFYETFGLIARFTTHNGYAAFLCGQPHKAIKHYRKEAEKGQLSPYEQRLYAFLHTPAAADYAALPSDCAPVARAREQVLGTRDALRFLGTVGVTYVAVAALFMLVAGGLYAFLCADAAYAPFDWIFVLVLALLPSVFGAIGLRRWLYPKLFAKEADRWLALDELENSPRSNAVCHWLAGVLLALCLYLNVVFTLCVPRVYEDRLLFDDGSAFPFLSSQTYLYEDVQRVACMEGRYNTFDELVDRPSYVLLFEDGRVIDLDAGLTVEETQEWVLPRLQPYVEDIECYSDDRALAQAWGISTEDLFAW